MSEICSNCEIFNTGMSMELISANLTLFLTVLNCVEVRRCPHSGVGRDFLLHRRITFTKTVQNLRLGPPAARSTFVPLCSNRLGPPEPSDRHFGQLGPIWAVFGGPWAKFGGTQLLQIGSKSSTWTSHSPFHLCSTLFQPFGTTGAFRSPFWPTWALFGLFLGPRGPKFDKFCVGEVERGPGHLES